MSELVLENELPKGWIKTNIGSISKIIHYGYTATSILKNTGTKYLRITDIQNNHVNWDKVPFCKISKEEKKKFLLKENDIVFARTGGTVGKSYLIKQDVPSAVFASYLIRIVLTENTVPKFIHFFFQSADYWRQIQFGKTGLKTNVNAQILSKLVFHLPPLNEQKRIVAKIEELFSLIDSIIQSLNQIKFQMNQFKRSLLIQTFEKNSDKWKEETINDVIKIIDYRGRTPPYSNDGIPHLRSNNVKNCRIIWENLKFVAEETYDKYMTRGIPQKGDLLFTTEAPLGEISLVPVEKFSLAQRLMILRPLEHDSKFLMYQIISPDFHNRLTGKKTGTTVTGISSRNFKPMKIFTTSLDEEKKIAIYLENQFSKLESLLLIVEKNLKILCSMKKSILKQAFEGKLVPQDPNDEPAEILLQKIKQKKEQLIQKQKPSKRNGK